MRGPSRRPLVCLLVVGGVAGVVLAVWVPRLGTTAEAQHFARAWAISDWDLLPDRNPPPRGGDGSLICLPGEVADQIFEAAPPPGADSVNDAHRRPGGSCGGDTLALHVGEDASVPPVAFVGPAAGIAAARFVGADVETQVLVARLASLAVYLALCALGVVWAPRARWALVAVALVPLSLTAAVIAAPSRGYTIGASIVVVGSALRLVDPALEISTRRRWLEAAGACAIVACAEPPFVLLVAAYLTVLGGRVPAPDRPPRAPVLVPATVAVGAAALWHWSWRGLQACELRYPGEVLDAGRSAGELVRAPWRVVAAAGDALSQDGRAWLRQAALVDVVPWPLWIAGSIVLGLVLVALVPDRVEESRRSELTNGQRAVLVLVGVGVALAAIGWWLVACSPIGLEVGEPYPVISVLPAATPLLAGCSLPGRGRYRVRLPWILLVVGAIYAVWLAALLGQLR